MSEPTRFYLIHARTLEALPEYSCSVPTGTTIGKLWKRDGNAYASLRRGYGRAWWIGRYEEHPDPNKVMICFYFPIVVPDWHVEGPILASEEKTDVRRTSTEPTRERPFRG